MRPLSPREAQQDLDQLEWLIENRYSYRDLKRVDYRACLDAIRAGIGEGIPTEDFAYQLHKMIALFGDGHSKVGSYAVSLGSLCDGFLPFLVDDSNGRAVAFQADRPSFVDPEYPFVRALDGFPVEKWFQATSQWAPQGSPDLIRHQAIRNLRYVALLRWELGLPENHEIAIELETEDGKSTKSLSLPLARQGPVYGLWPRPAGKIQSIMNAKVEHRLLSGNIGYLRIPFMLAEPEFLEDLLRAIKQLAGTDGLIIDIRDNGGGSRVPLKVLFPFFMKPTDPPRVVNIAASHLGVINRKEALEGRYLYPASSRHWTVAERQAITACVDGFRPEWSLPEGDFSDWHYFVISPSQAPACFYYNKPVVVLQNRQNFSAGDIFLGAFKDWRNVTLMGLPSGGDSGCRVEYRLRNSGIAIYLSSIASFQPNGHLYDGNGIQPDLRVEPEPTYFTGKTDFALQEAVRHLQSVGK